MHTDASDYAVGVCLTQRDYNTRTFTSRLILQDKSCPIVKKLCNNRERGIVRSERVRQMVGRHYSKNRDGSQLVTILAEKTPKSPKLTLWLLALPQWSYKITHRTGVKHQGAMLFPVSKWRFKVVNKKDNWWQYKKVISLFF